MANIKNPVQAISFRKRVWLFLFKCWNMPENIIIVSGGHLGDLTFFQEKAACKDRLLIACDGGARHLSGAGLKPDVLIGDMDSLSPERLAEHERQGIKILRYPADKDYTDTALALDYALELHPKSIDIWGALGGRIDHALANIHLLIRGVKAGIPTCLVDEFAEVKIADDQTRFVNAVGCLVSLIALSPVVEGITLTGFEYPLTHENLNLSESRGISNIVAASPASIRVETGHLLVIRYWRKDVFPEV